MIEPTELTLTLLSSEEDPSTRSEEYQQELKQFHKTLQQNSISVQVARTLGASAGSSEPNANIDPNLLSGFVC